MSASTTSRTWIANSADPRAGRELLNQCSRTATTGTDAKDVAGNGRSPKSSQFGPTHSSTPVSPPQAIPRLRANYWSKTLAAPDPLHDALRIHIYRHFIEPSAPLEPSTSPAHLKRDDAEIEGPL